jgi:CheY-like chemotaxis protein
VKKIEKVLLIEDDRITNYLNEKIILKMDIANEIVATLNGREALTYLQETEVFPALIILDISMPVVDGYNFLEQFKNLKFYEKKTIIVILTSSEDLDDMIRLKYLGKYSYYNKPLTVEKMQHIYQEYFKEDQTDTMA